MKTHAVLLALALLMPGAALAEDPDTDLNGHRYCNLNGADLRETGDGGYSASLGFEFKGDVANATYPAGSARLFGPHEELYAYVLVDYEFLIDANGRPASSPEPQHLSISTGRFAAPRLEPFGSLELVLKAGQMTSPPIALNEAYYSTIALLGGEIASAESSSSPYDTEMKQSDLNDLVAAFENGERWLVLSQFGKEVARIPVPKRDYSAERDAKIAWIRKTQPLLAQGKCE